MLCPKCKSEMEKVQFQSIEVDRCTRCHGIWFDMLEADRLKALAGSEAIDVGDPTEGRKNNQKGDIDCPRCGTRMLAMVDARQPHIWYESCASCFGVYFDAGEFRDYKEESLWDFFKDLVARPRDRQD